MSASLRAGRLRAAAALAALGALAGGVGLGWAWPTPDDGLPALLRWQPGQAYRYRFEFSSSDRVALFGSGRAELSGEAQVAGELELRAYGERSDGAHELGLRFTGVTRQRFEALGRELAGADARQGLLGPEALLLAAPSGKVLSVEYPASAPKLFRQTVQGLLGDAQLDLKAGARRWEAAETTLRGEASSRYEVVRAGWSARAVRRTRDRYPRLLALQRFPDCQQRVGDAAEVVLEGEGELARLDATTEIDATHQGETVLTARGRLLLERVSVAPLDGLAGELLAKLRREGAYEPGRPPEAPAETPEERKLALERVARGATEPGMLAVLRLLGQGTPLPRDFLWRTGAFLRLHPEALPALLELFRAPDCAGEVRVAIAALLVSAGTEEAQETLRSLLAAEEARRDPRYADLVTQLSFLSRPAAGTLEALQDLERRGQGELRVAAAYALGAAVGNAFRAGDRETALGFNRELVGALAATGDPALQRELLTSLGNAGLDPNVPAIAQLASSADPEVRASVANALRKTQVPAAEQQLLSLVADPAPQVQDAALTALRGYRLRPDLLSAVEQHVRAGRVEELNFTSVIGLVGGQQVRRDCGPQVRSLLQAMLARPIQRIELRQLIEQALASL